MIAWALCNNFLLERRQEHLMGHVSRTTSLALAELERLRYDVRTQAGTRFGRVSVQVETSLLWRAF